MSAYQKLEKHFSQIADFEHAWDAAMLAQLPDLEHQIRRGEFAEVKQWLNGKIWSQGSRYEMQELMVQATGKPLDASDFKKHLESRYLK